jgi:hypothetical protein
MFQRWLFHLGTTAPSNQITTLNHYVKIDN